MYKCELFECEPKCLLVLGIKPRPSPPKSPSIFSQGSSPFKKRLTVEEMHTAGVRASKCNTEGISVNECLAAGSVSLCLPIFLWHITFVDLILCRSLTLSLGVTAPQPHCAGTLSQKSEKGAIWLKHVSQVANQGRNAMKLVIHGMK